MQKTKPNKKLQNLSLCLSCSHPSEKALRTFFICFFIPQRFFDWISVCSIPFFKRHEIPDLSALAKGMCELSARDACLHPGTFEGCPGHCQFIVWHCLAGWGFKQTAMNVWLKSTAEVKGWAGSTGKHEGLRCCWTQANGGWSKAILLINSCRMGEEISQFRLSSKLLEKAVHHT